MKRAINFAPLAVIVLLMLGSLPMVGSASTWLTLSIAGVAMGLIIFVAASGLTLIFGLMDVLQFGHGLFVAIGGYVAAAILVALQGAAQDSAVLGNVFLLLAAFAGATVVAAVLGVAFEKAFIKPVYGNHLKQILSTTGGMIIGTEALKIVWGPDSVTVPVPTILQGSILIGDGTVVEITRILAIVLGAAVFIGMWWMLHRTRVGLLVRAGVQDREMVEALGYRISVLFGAVFIGGCAMAGVGGTLWALYQQSMTPNSGAQLNVLMFIVIVMGGLGSVSGVLYASLLVGLLANYTSFVAPTVGLFSTIGLMIVMLLWRPSGLGATARS
ncbi:branched-chain amino acid ABC transporter permease [Caballeronia sp. ATUFL_M1_KS5A]|uniref:branched-chain amino acid ABC transporter permease n=1 Tax=Caballeronia sp. ATUFL_M1_KS5A TaxID=2921778 RepID=UPI0020290979|nr:branched-chain amino acid ABC transporter permease [Caballeronia sp. ATUFL_M1_KS5A]